MLLRRLLSTRKLPPKYSDVVVIGGGAIGSSVAYWLKEGSDRSVTVIEKDLTYSKSSTVLSVGGIRQQFSLPENIQMSLFGAEFFATLKNKFGPDNDIQFVPNGYLILASEDGAQQLTDNFLLQKELGAVGELLSENQLQKRFPWLNTSDVKLGCLGLEKEGWFDPWALLTLFKNQATKKGASFIQGEVVDFSIDDNNLKQVEIQLANGLKHTMEFHSCVIAAGADSGELAKLAKIGTEKSGVLSIPLPVEKRKRFVYRFDSQGANAPSSHTPLLIDFTGAYFRKDGLGNCFIGGLSPQPEDEPTTNNLDVDFEFFDDKVWPLLANRVPAFESVKVRSAWAGFYEYNCFDENGIIGTHPYYKNLYFATGFSGHGIQQSPAVGRAIAELILHGNYKSIDLTRLSFQRLVDNKPMPEIGIY